ncbi:ABC transporter ATP-binding protein [Streptococcus suis]|uniref:ATP-binding cassette domain-containing protein n=1 Tax=Streptococcus suis TaxID=1307 RepID=UPI00040909B7|nr:ABC transporter ATP-binding protein [Streptococcus suis]MCK3965275.1 ABC transporter ATP-binding protein [Streptococcus suis]HEL1708517.1 ABC transporter ATP-binding protein [Streptococcus suis]HEL1776826.1 ABC transporter ATP-binding protein [Streptococcus suis]HEL1838120.1 ABC transporter ATP-binding protein [Streptococcus suis]HEL2005445.1 ABC transporter ATP-binding protein [Streptococcus suis]
MLTIDHLSKKFGQQQVITNLNLQIEKQGVHIIVGTNGSGKTTLMNTLTNIIKADSGSITCNGHSVESKQYKESIFYIPSDFYLPEYLTAIEYLDFMLPHYPKSDNKQLDILLDIFDLGDHRNKLLETFSFGMKKKIQLIAAIASNVDYVIADELFGGLDFDTVLLVQELLQVLQKERSFIIVSHDLNTLLAFPDNIYIMANGQVNSFRDKVENINKYIKEEGNLSAKIQNIQEYFVPSQYLH